MYTWLAASKKCGWYWFGTRNMVLVEGQLTLLPGVNIRLGGFHYLLSSTGSIGTIMTGNGADASSIHARPFII